MSALENFVDKISDHDVTIGVIGMGYVGLPLALEFALKKHQVIGFDIDPQKVTKIHAGETYIKHIPSQRIAEAVDSGFLNATSDLSRIAETDAVIICVPTPLDKHREPDMSYIVSTAESIAPYIKSNQLITLESTTYPGTTEELLIPILQDASGLSAGKDFWVAFSPEREDPNNPRYNTSTIPKVIGGYSADCLTAALKLYNEIIERTVPVTSCSVAEATKLLENIFRSVNIALVNELKVIFYRMNIDIWEVVGAASTKPFGYMPFYPGPGLGGHCIPIDPFYLTWKAKEYGISTKFIELAGEINSQMPEYVLHRTMEELNWQTKPVKDSKILIVGLAYKNDIDDLRESPSLVLIELFEERGAIVDYHDPFIPVVPVTREHAELAGRESVPLENAGNYDVAVISTKHSVIDWDLLVQKCPLIIDTRNAIPDKYNNVKKA